jgi:DNA repair protein RadA/Sms
MKKIKTIFACQNCGYQTPKWMGKCPDCGSWNAFAEETYGPSASRSLLPSPISSRDNLPQPIPSIETAEKGRMKTQIAEFDRVLGGGVVQGSLVLIGGDPGIGKSTLLLQAVDRLASREIPVLYISGEESLQQIKMRADRLGVTSPSLLVLAENSLEKILEETEKLQPKVLVIDSIQTVYTSELSSAPGSIGQVRESSGKLMILSKTTGLCTFLIGHVTKEGAIAGPRVLEHMVDTVLYFEGDRGPPLSDSSSRKESFRIDQRNRGF